MKIAIVYNRVSQRVINLFGVKNRERYGLKAIKRISDALKTGGHTVKAFEGDKDLIKNLEDFMPRVLKGERPGMVFNLAYGIQGQARYTHVPGILEMVGMPYVGSGPLAHSLALDKVVAKMIFIQNGLPTPEFAVLESPDFELPELEYPLIVKPKHEAVSFGLKIVHDPDELRTAAQAIFDQFGQAVLVERYIDGREINVGVLGNDPPVALPPVELDFGAGARIYTEADKKHKSGRDVGLICPAPIDEALKAQAQALAVRAFQSLGLYDCARVDMRLDPEGRLYILEINSLPSLGAGGSYVAAARHAGLEFPALVNELVEVATKRYFGTAHPPKVPERAKDKETKVFDHLIARRDPMQRRLKEWVNMQSRTHDVVGLNEAAGMLGAGLVELGLAPLPELGDERSIWTWATPAGLDGGTLLVAQLDVPHDPAMPITGFRAEAEAFFGEGVGISRAPLTSIEFALKALRSARLLRSRKIGVLVYGDEGQECRYSTRLIREAMARAGRVLVVRPGNPGEKLLSQRRGQRRYRLVVRGKPQRLGRATPRQDVLRWTHGQLETFAGLSDRERRIAVAATEVHTHAFPMLLPHEVQATVLMAYADADDADEIEAGMRAAIADSEFGTNLRRLSDRPPMTDRKRSARLARELLGLAERWDLPLATESSVLPSVAGLAPSDVPVVCGLGPVANDAFTPAESISRLSLLQRTLLLALALVQEE
jgi:D-alanine-D-alanine ligase